MSVGKFRRFLEASQKLFQKTRRYAPYAARMLGLMPEFNQYQGLDYMLRSLSSETNGNFSMAFSASGSKPPIIPAPNEVRSIIQPVEIIKNTEKEVIAKVPEDTKLPNNRNQMTIEIPDSVSMVGKVKQLASALFSKNAVYPSLSAITPADRQEMIDSFNQKYGSIQNPKKRKKPRRDE